MQCVIINTQRKQEVIMLPLSYTQIQHVFTTIKSRSQQIVTNYFFNTQENLFLYYQDSDACIFLQKQNDFYRLYFIGSEQAYIEYLLQTLTIPFRVILENVTTNQALSLSTWHYETTYVRLAKTLRLSSDSTMDSSRYVATLQAEHLLRLLCRDFNKYFDYLPSVAALQRRIDSKHVLCITRENKLALGDISQSILGYLVFIPKGKSAYLNFIANYGGKTSLLTLWNVFYTCLSKFRIGSLHLWCNIHNQKAMRMYTKESFMPSGLQNIIYSKNLFAKKICFWTPYVACLPSDIHSLSPLYSINLYLRNTGGGGNYPS